jgi:hypothetical protein
LSAGDGVGFDMLGFQRIMVLDDAHLLWFDVPL